MRRHIYDSRGTEGHRDSSGKLVKILREPFPFCNNAMREIVWNIRLLLYYDSDFVFLEFMSFKCGNSIRMKVHKYQDNRWLDIPTVICERLLFFITSNHLNILVKKSYTYTYTRARACIRTHIYIHTHTHMRH